MSGNDEENDEPSRRSTKDKNYGEEPPHDCSNGQFTASATPTAAESKSSISNNHRSSSSVDHLVEMLLKESPKLGTLCESKFADNDEDRKPAAASNQHQPSNPPSLQIVRSTIEAILQSEDIFAQILEQQTSRRKANNRKKKQPKSIADCTDPSRIPIKTVSFSSISAPHDEDEVDNNYNSTDDEIAQHLLPPILPRQQQQQQDRRLVRSNSPSIRYNRRQQQQQQQQQQQNSSSPVADISAGETTASGDSSVISAHNRANASSSPGAAAAASAAQVHFSAMNPNPQLILGSSNNSHGSHTPTVRFTLDRSVSWEDEQLQHGGSRASRSGLSSPSIEPALSPPRSRSRSPLQIHFNDSAIVETITEAAARLRIHNNNNNNNEHRSTPRVVHFSAMKDATVVPRDEEAPNNHRRNSSESNIIDLDYDDRTAPHSRSLAAKIRFRPISSSGPTHSHDPAEINAVADRFRRLIRRAEQVDNITLEAAFEHFDQDHSGTITPLDLQLGLQNLGDTFHFTLEECSALLACLSGKSTGINLLGFYRAMGRRSPPPERIDKAQHQENNDIANLLASSPVVHAQDAANRLRNIVLEAERNDGTPLESSFRLFDPTGSGHISAVDFRLGLQELGTSDRELLSMEDCEELVALFDTNNDGRVSLLEFYRFMGRRSPPPSRTDDESYDELDSPDQE